MNLPDNIIKQHLRDVYFISGSACGGKSTIARYLSSRYELTAYSLDEKYPHHKALSDPQHQPSMNRSYGSWDAYFNRPPAEYAECLRQSMEEQAAIAIVELLSMAEGRRIVVDGAFPCHMLQRISAPDRVVFLLAEIDAIRHNYLNRADKADMAKCLAQLNDPEESTQNMFRAIEHSLARELNEVKASGFKWFLRQEHTNWDAIRSGVEQHFRLTQGPAAKQP
jgi:cytidylate kinase